jgi:hypothetical protein
MAESSERAPTPDEASYVAAARDKAFMLYEGARTPHRSCGIALAKAFGLPTRPYQATRRSGEALCRFASERPASIALEDP